RGLHAARAAGLEGRSGDVQPDVAPGDERRRDRHAVVLEERDTARDPGFALQREQRLRDALRVLVERVRLPGEHELQTLRTSVTARAGSSERRCSRLYVASRRAKPTVSRDGSNVDAAA